MSSDIIYYLWLAQSFSYGSDKPYKIIKKYDDLEEFYRGGLELYRTLDFLNNKDINSLKNTKLEECNKIIENCKKHNIRMLCPEDGEYPDRLKNIASPPAVLYIQGDIKGLDDEIGITVVGTRKISDYGKSITGNLSYFLTRAGAIIISGCAEGADTYAHTGALKAGGITIGVLACGHDINYPISSEEMKKYIVKNGALVGELPPGFHVNKSIFHVRNRLMSGLSLGVLVTEAPERSGSLITVTHALEQGKDVFCVPPHEILNSNFGGSAKLLTDGATPVSSAMDILNVYLNQYPHKIDVDKMIKDAKRVKAQTKQYTKHNDHTKQTKNVKSENMEKQKKESKQNKIKNDIKNSERASNNKSISAEEKGITEPIQIKVYNTLSVKPKHIDIISEETKLETKDLFSALTYLEIMGYIRSYAGGLYSLV